MARWQLFVSAGAVFGGLGVLAGAFGAHALEARLEAQALQTWDTAVFYQLVHALLLFATGLWFKLGYTAPDVPPASLSVAAFALIAGMLLFCGSLYLLALGGPRALGPVTPLGGVAFVVGWLSLALAALRSASRR
jgi:uncharacterized membrane protein YgdD (TMEM256/DUF423 family)